MLGNLVLEAEGKVKGIKRLPNGRYQVTAGGQGTFLGDSMTGGYIGESEVRQDGTLFGRFQASLSMENDVTVQMTGIANGVENSGTNHWKGGACFYAPPGKYARLNSVAVFLEIDIDSGGVLRVRGWEWR